MLRLMNPFKVFLVIFFVALAFPDASWAVPSYARQMEMPCTGCHVQFPVLNSFGRAFKLSGYTLNARSTITAVDERKQKILDLPLPALLSLMFQGNFTRTDQREPGSENNNIDFPAQLSVFLAGRIAPKVGSFVQVTYSGADDKVGFDNADIRFADTTQVFDKSVVWGVTLNNNPTVTDPYNTTPAWGFPYASSEGVPTPAASALINGGLAQQVAGVTAYALVDDLVYVELGVYGSAPLGVARPLNRATRSGTVSGATPYWRVALQHTWGQNAFVLGHFGIAAHQNPDATSANNRFTDLGFDFQFRRPVGPGVLQLQARYVYERARWGLGNSANRRTDLHQFSADVTYYWGQRFSFTVAPFAIMGNQDSVLYAAGAVGGSVNGKPDSTGAVVQVSFNPWLNTRLTMQYTAYGKFNGRRDNYDGSGRDASDNNTLLLQTWLAW